MIHEMGLWEIKPPHGIIKDLYLLDTENPDRLIKVDDRYRLLVDVVPLEVKIKQADIHSAEGEVPEDKEASEGSLEPEEKKPKKRPIDAGKVMALRDAGWSYKEIGEERGISLEGARQVYLRAMDLKEKKK